MLNFTLKIAHPKTPECLGNRISRSATTIARQTAYKASRA
jgi:hypothetical protein